jgi:hypothetical protein
MRLSLVLALAATPFLSAPAFADCADDIKAILKAAQTSGPYRMETTVSSSAGDMTMTAEVIPPTAMHSVTDVGGQTMEMTFLDGKGWMNMAGTWTELPPEQAATITQMFDPAIIDSGELTNEECVGVANVDGMDVMQYNYTFGMQGVTSDNVMYVDPESGLPIGLEATSDVGGETAETSVTYEFDDSVTVTAPQM